MRATHKYNQVKHISIKIHKTATSSFQIKYLYILKERQHYNYFSRLIYHFSLLYAIVKSTLSSSTDNPSMYWQPINVCQLNISHLSLNWLSNKTTKELVIPANEHPNERYCKHYLHTAPAIKRQQNSNSKFSVSKILKCDHSYESCWAVISFGDAYYVVEGDSNFWVCGLNPKVWPFKRKLLSSTFLWCCELCCNYWFSAWTFKRWLNLLILASSQSWLSYH